MWYNSCLFYRRILKEVVCYFCYLAVFIIVTEARNISFPGMLKNWYKTTFCFSAPCTSKNSYSPFYVLHNKRGRISYWEFNAPNRVYLPSIAQECCASQQKEDN